ncbi:acireductone synthase-like protein [Peziza echinospora]|nr:acireductone synthase-like protein [Peziza echinospora]
MAVSKVRGVLLDIEGTVCSISFVRDVLFPYALQALPAFLQEKWDSADFAPYKAAFPEHARQSPAVLEEYVRDLTARDVKVACLKGLQGLLWRAGFESHTIKTPLYPDVYPALVHWSQDLGISLVIYSSGSVDAQRLLFSYTDVPETVEGGAREGDVTPLVKGWYDTVNAGGKQEAESYGRIARDMGVAVGEWLFLSDNVREVEAAKAAGMQSIVVNRPGNAPLSPQEASAHRVLENGFGELLAGEGRVEHV